MTDNWIGAAQTQQFLRQVLQENSIVVRDNDEIPTSSRIYKIFKLVGSEGEPGQVRIAKIFRHVDNEVPFHEFGKYHQIGVETINNPDLGAACTGTVMNAIPANTMQNTRSVLVTSVAVNVPLSSIVVANGFLPPRFSLIFLREAIRALESLHNKYLVHTDLKPEDFLLVSASNSPITRRSQPLCNHPILRANNFSVLLQNLENSKEHSVKKRGRGNGRAHIPFHMLPETAYGRHTVWKYSPPTRNSLGRKIPLGRRDDILSLIYIVVDLHTGSLPWTEEFEGLDVTQHFHTVLSMRKKNTSVAELTEHVHADLRVPLEQILQTVQEQMTFSSVPPYDEFIELVNERIAELYYVF